ncbi:unnamed protein product [Caenorhabditis sp. 36 PRJEB53466]|nr:unnamed protein product [Caenorhabditis sp. 36 PRJEB53466]
MSISTIRRQVKNVAYNFSGATTRSLLELKVDAVVSTTGTHPWMRNTKTRDRGRTVLLNSDPFEAWDTPAQTSAIAPNGTSMSLLGGDLLAPDNSLSTDLGLLNGTRKTPENFLGENSNFVNLDNLLGGSTTSQTGGNPFLTGATPALNPFAAQQRKSPTLNEMRAAQGQAPPISKMAPRGTLPQTNPFANPF